MEGEFNGEVTFRHRNKSRKQKEEGKQRTMEGGQKNFRCRSKSKEDTLLGKKVEEVVVFEVDEALSRLTGDAVAAGP